MERHQSRLPPEAPPGFPELTELGKRIEMLRIERGISKQHLARHAGTSRQQLWRVMTGKSEMSLGLRTRLADALNVANLHGRKTPLATAVAGATRAATSNAVYATKILRSPSGRPTDLAAYVASSTRIAQTLASLPVGESGRALKRRLLDAIEDAAIDAGLELDHAVFELRRKVLSGQL